ncbi:N-formylglutamate amidohydrolase [Rhodohalobacter sulfatireducens]|uniref:N-formylglutamate amidohydrolase n=1 Tax=Rhodohalobacter sulfatireducens TaxID=2911366 RepID=A0ABS9KA07_9BACT|nr:N-formylglutamate amidohydrolase [Rhodohalobacter sulfatireducens]MCG2587682.1 N-formylglutamate amidohydrolase [Rhodohalobacter sulfatireducens]
MERLTSPEWILTCEHAGNKIPIEYEYLFGNANEVLESHRGWDPGAFELAELFAVKTKVKLISYPYTRLLIEPNRSLGHPKLFSEFTRGLSTEEKQEIINNFYLPYRKRVTEIINENTLRSVPTIHISIHTFTPVLNKKTRDFEIGLLYDPKRTREKNLCLNWKSFLEQIDTELRIRMNQPYKGASDGFTTYLRKTFNENLYLGIELEINQNLFFINTEAWKNACVQWVQSFQQLNKKYT